MRMLALVKRILLEMIRDKRTLILLLIAPVLILSLMNYIFGIENKNLSLAITEDMKAYEEYFKASDIDVYYVGEVSESVIKENEYDGLLSIEKNQFHLMLLNNDPNQSNLLKMKLNQILLLSQTKLPIQTVDIITTYVYGHETSDFLDILSPILVSYLVFFFIFLISGIGLLRERMTGTLEHLMATPIRRREVVFGYLVGYGIFAVCQTLLITYFSVYVLDLEMAGSVLLVMFINLIVAFVALSLGILLSTFASNEFQMIQFIPIVIIPQIFFAGIFPIEDMNKFLQIIGRIFPIYYAADAMKGVMYKGEGIQDIYVELLILFVYIIVFMILNILALGKYRKKDSK